MTQDSWNYKEVLLGIRWNCVREHGNFFHFKINPQEHGNFCHFKKGSIFMNQEQTKTRAMTSVQTLGLKK